MLVGLQQYQLVSVVPVEEVVEGGGQQTIADYGLQVHHQGDGHEGGGEQGIGRQGEPVGGCLDVLDELFLAPFREQARDAVDDADLGTQVQMGRVLGNERQQVPEPKVRGLEKFWLRIRIGKAKEVQQQAAARIGRQPTGKPGTPSVNFLL